MSFASAVVKEWYASVMATASLPANLVVGGAAGVKAVTVVAMSARPVTTVLLVSNVEALGVGGGGGVSCGPRSGADKHEGRVQGAELAGGKQQGLKLGGRLLKPAMSSGALGSAIPRPERAAMVERRAGRILMVEALR